MLRLNPLILFSSGVYGPEDYYVALPLMVITLPSVSITTRGSLFAALPPELQQTVIDKVWH